MLEGLFALRGGYVFDFNDSDTRNRGPDPVLDDKTTKLHESVNNSSITTWITSGLAYFLPQKKGVAEVTIIFSRLKKGNDYWSPAVEELRSGVNWVLSDIRGYEENGTTILFNIDYRLPF